MGIDYLGGAKYPDVILREHPEGFAAGFFYSTFGDARHVISKLLATGRCPVVRVQIIWENDHKYDPRNHDKKIVAAIKELNKMKARFPNVDVQASPFCEHTIRGAQLRSLMTLCAKHAVNLTLVNNPWRGDTMPGMINETHDTGKALSGRYNFSFDGVACVDADAEKIKGIHSRADIFFLWDARFNGKWESNEKTPIAQRKGWPDSKLIDSIIYLSRSKGGVRLDRKWLYKSHSENKGNGDRRAEHPVIISPVKTNSIELVASNGQVVDSLKYYGPYTDGRHRYYSSNWGYEIAEKAKRIQGQSIVSVRAKGKVYGTCNPAFRENEWRNKA
jgi:hypothetical protein